MLQVCRSRVASKSILTRAFLLYVFNRLKDILYLILFHLQIDVDEKWFDMVKLETRTRSRASDAVPSSKCVIHKSHIPKMMFLAAVGVPHYSPDNKQYSDGKIGIWPFVEYRPAANSSANRPKGAMVLYDVSVTAETFNDMMTKKGGVFDSIREVHHTVYLLISAWSNAQ